MLYMNSSKKLIVDEVEIGSGNDKVLLTKDSFIYN